MGELVEDGEGVWPRNASRWWKDVASLSTGVDGDWFNVEVDRCIGNGSSTSFWKASWRGNVSFMVRFNRLYSISLNQGASVQEMRRSNLQGGEWAFVWRRQLFVWENNLLTELKGELDGFELNIDEGRWKCRLEEDHIFSVKSMYLKLERNEFGFGRPEGERRVFRQIWKIGAPAKAIAFFRKALLD